MSQLRTPTAVPLSLVPCHSWWYNQETGHQRSRGKWVLKLYTGRVGTKRRKLPEQYLFRRLTWGINDKGGIRFFYHRPYLGAHWPDLTTVRISFCFGKRFGILFKPLLFRRNLIFFLFFGIALKVYQPVLWTLVTHLPQCWKRYLDLIFFWWDSCWIWWGVLLAFFDVHLFFLFDELMSLCRE